MGIGPDGIHQCGEVAPGAADCATGACARGSRSSGSIHPILFPTRLYTRTASALPRPDLSCRVSITHGRSRLDLWLEVRALSGQPAGRCVEFGVDLSSGNGVGADARAGDLRRRDSGFESDLLLSRNPTDERCGGHLLGAPGNPDRASVPAERDVGTGGRSGIRHGLSCAAVKRPLADPDLPEPALKP